MDLEARIYELNGLHISDKDDVDAEDNMSTTDDQEESEQIQLELVWKRTVSKMRHYPAKAHIMIRQAVLDAIAQARKAHAKEAVTDLKVALLEFHPESAGACKAAALAVLAKHGGISEEFDDDSDDEDDAMEEENTDDKVSPEEEGVNGHLPYEVAMMNASLNGHEPSDCKRIEWINTVKSCKTVAKFASLATAFVHKANGLLTKLEQDQSNLSRALDAWQNGKKHVGDSEVWTNATYTDEFCLAKADQYPWWPARKCVPKDEALAAKLVGFGKTLVSLFGEFGGLRVVDNAAIRPYSEELPQEDEAAAADGDDNPDQNLQQHSKDVRNQLEDAMNIARRLTRGMAHKAGNGSKSHRKSDTFQEEKKLD